MCEVLDIHRSTYYKYRHTLDPDYPDHQMLKELSRQHKKTLEYRRITQVLATELGVLMNHKKVLRIMTKYGLRPPYIKNLRSNYSKQRNAHQAQADNLQRHFNQRGWVTDITYLMVTTNGKGAYQQEEYDIAKTIGPRYWITYTLTQMSLNRSGYYKWLKREGKMNPYKAWRHQLRQWIEAIHQQHKTYGYRSIAARIRTLQGVHFSDL
jgi:transposase InsO family protein